MTPLGCIIVDDEPLALDILEDYIRRTPALELVGRFTSSSDALARLQEGGVELAFLDIQMPGLGGLDLARALGEGSGTRVVFTTAFPQYALDGFRVDALDYLLKPISFDEFSRAVGRAVEWFRIKSARAGDEPRHLIVKSDYKQFVIPVDTIVYIEATRDYIRIHTSDGGAIQTLMNLRTAEELLPEGHFARVHRSYIVALGSIRRIERSHIILTVGSSGTEISIPVSDTYKDSFARALASRAL
jgi:DNA-binding LytR/AlgR family response regulator